MPTTCPNSKKCGGRSSFHTNTMPPDRNSSRDAFDINKLDLQALDTSDGLGAALRLIRSACYRGDPGIAGMVAALNSHTYLFEYLISGTLCISIAPGASRTPVILPSSTRRGRVREAPEMDSDRISHTHNAEFNGCHEYAPTPEFLIFVDIRGVSVHRQ